MEGLVQDTTGESARRQVISPRRRAGSFAPLLRKGSLAVTDQALFSGANFLVNVLLARQFAAGEYGAYSLAYACFLLFSALHQALLIEPMMIFGSAKYCNCFPRYLTLLIACHAALLVPTSLLLWVLSQTLGRVYFAPARSAFEGMALASAFILLFWLIRRVFYVLAKPAWGVLSSLLYLLVLASVVGVLWATQALNPRTAFLAMGLAGLLVSAFLFWRVARLSPPAGKPLRFAQVVADHWQYGRWSMASALASWFPQNIYYLLLSAWLGLEGAGALRALMNFIMPVTQAVIALNMLMIPSLVRDRHSGGTHKMNQTMSAFLAVLGVGCTGYLAALWLFRSNLFQIFYGGRYSEYQGWPLVLAGAIPIGTCIYSVIGNGIRALERPDRMFWAFVASAAAAVAFGIPLTSHFGVSGALLGNHCSAIVFIAALWWIYRSLSRSPQPLPETAVAANPS